MPISDYGDSAESLDVRSKLVMQYGEDTVRWSEIATVVQLMFAVGIIKPTEFIALVEKQCSRVDERRRRAAGFD
jgi:hypothetical protein